jgi:hypothetical protein
MCVARELPRKIRKMGNTSGRVKTSVEHQKPSGKKDGPREESYHMDV